MISQEANVQPGFRPAGRRQEVLNLHRILAMVRRRLLLLLVVGGAIFLAAVVIALRTTPLYTATARVMLDTRKSEVVEGQGVLSNLGTESSSVDTEAEVLRSRQLAERVAKELKLDKDAEFNRALAKPTGLSGVISSVSDLLGSATPNSAGLDEVDQQKAHEKVIDQLQRKLAVKRAGLTYVIDVSVTSESAQKAAIIANKFTDLYLLEQMETKFNATRDATGWLNGKLTEMRAQVQADDAAVQAYRVANNLMSANVSSLTEGEISTYNQQQATARAQAEEDRARLESARAQLATGADNVGEASTSPVVSSLRAQRAQLSAKVADLEGKYGPKHPEMLTAQRQLADIDTAIRQEVGRVIQNLEAKSQVSRQRLNVVQGAASQARGALASSNRALVKLNDLQRTADASRALYEAYLTRFKETSSAEGTEQSDSRKVSAAKIPTHASSPDLKLSLALGLILGSIGALGALIIAENLDNGLTTTDDVERKLGQRYLAGVPSLSSVADQKGLAPADYIMENPLSSFAESFRNLRAAVQSSRPGHQVKVVAITSALPGEGKTVTAICLARSAAIQGSRVIVVDCDLRRRTLKRVVHLDHQVGLMEVLSGQATLEQAVVVDEGGAMILPLSDKPYTGKDVFGSPAMVSLLDDLRKRFDFIILDTAPILPVVDTRVLAGLADVTVFLARWRKTPQQAIEASLRILGQTGAYMAGVALTQINMKQQVKYAYGDPGYYYSQYKSYYTTDKG